MSSPTKQERPRTIPTGHEFAVTGKLLRLRQARESSDNPILNAFCRVAPSLRFSFLAIFLAGVFLRAADFKSRTSAAVQLRLFDARLAMQGLQI